MGTKNMAVLVRLPAGENINEWLATNIIDFFNELNLIYGAVHQNCTNESCPVMCAGNFQYLWADETNYKTPTKLSAPSYVDTLFDWAELQFNDEAIFPIHETQKFPKDFVKRVGVIMRRFFRVYAHIYHHHIDYVCEIQAESHLNSCFKHLIFFAIEFSLMETKEMQPLEEIIEKLREKDSTPN